MFSSRLKRIMKNAEAGICEEKLGDESSKVMLTPSPSVPAPINLENKIETHETIIKTKLHRSAAKQNSKSLLFKVISFSF